VEITRTGDYSVALVDASGRRSGRLERETGFLGWWARTKG